MLYINVEKVASREPPGSAEYYEILDADEAKREELYRKYGIVEDEEKKAVALQA